MYKRMKNVKTPSPPVRILPLFFGYVCILADSHPNEQKKKKYENKPGSRSTQTFFPFSSLISRHLRSNIVSAFLAELEGFKTMRLHSESRSDPRSRVNVGLGGLYGRLNNWVWIHQF